MALGAVLSKFILVNIGVTIGTMLVFHTGKFLEFITVFRRYGMTIRTRCLLMFTGKRKTGRGMIKFNCGFERFKSVTIGTGRRKRLLVIIGMTAFTPGIQSKVGEFFLFNRLICNIFRFMTILTGFGRMSAL